MLFGSAQMEMTVFGVLVFQFCQFAFPDLPGRAFFGLSVCFFCFCSVLIIAAAQEVPGSFPEASGKHSFGVKGRLQE